MNVGSRQKISTSGSVQNAVRFGFAQIVAMIVAVGKGKLMGNEARKIHWAGTPHGVCARKDSKADVRIISPKITETAEAFWYGNVTCWRCRRAHNKAYSKNEN